MLINTLTAFARTNLTSIVAGAASVAVAVPATLYGRRVLKEVQTRRAQKQIQAMHASLEKNLDACKAAARVFYGRPADAAVTEAELLSFLVASEKTRSQAARAASAAIHTIAGGKTA